MALPKTQNPSRTDYSAAFYREKPPEADCAKHLRLFLARHGSGFPYYPARRIDACGL